VIQCELHVEMISGETSKNLALIILEGYLENFITFHVAILLKMRSQLPHVVLEKGTNNGKANHPTEWNADLGLQLWLESESLDSRFGAGSLIRDHGLELGARISCIDTDEKNIEDHKFIDK